MDKQTDKPIINLLTCPLVFKTAPLADAEENSLFESVLEGKITQLN